MDSIHASEPGSEEKHVLIVLMPYGCRTYGLVRIPSIAPNIATAFFIETCAAALGAWTKMGCAFLESAEIFP